MLSILLVPFVATLVTFFRYIVGWKSLSIYTTVLLTFAFFELSKTATGTDVLGGFAQALIFMSAILLVGFPLHILSKDIRLHYLAKMSIIITLATLAVLAGIIVMVQMNIPLFNQHAPLAFIIMIFALDIFIKTYIRKSAPKTIRYMINTLGLAFGIYFFISIRPLQEAILTYPEIIGGLLLVNFLIGRWTSLRFTEYFRFKDINIKDLHDSEHHQK